MPICALLLAVTLPACAAPDAPEDVTPLAEALTASTHKVVFVIAMENTDGTSIYGNHADAPFINDVLVPQYATAANFMDELPSLPSEPHYLVMEAGTNAFSDHTFTGDAAPSSSNSTASTAHIATQIKNATNGVTWRSYQEGLNSSTGTCPIKASGFYAPKHDPFVFFRDVVGNTPSKTNAYCTAHHKALSKLAADLANESVATYNFITPNLCNDMHGASGCPDSNRVRSGDTWLANHLPPIIDYVEAHDGVVFITWDEGEDSNRMPFLAIGPHVKQGFVATGTYDHRSLAKTIETILELPVMAKVSTTNDLGEVFEAGTYP